MSAARTPARIDLNCDMGEGFGAYTLGLDAGIIPHVTSANIACGFHAGDPGWMRATVTLAERHGVAIGAHPGFPDMRGFGRRALQASPAEIADDLVYQIGALTAFTGAKRLQHVKPHGALYNMAVGREDVARGMGLRVAREVFADRAFDAGGALVPRTVPGAVLHDASLVIERSLRLVIEHRVTAITGEDLELHADTICLHSDTPGAVTLAASLRQAFERAGVGTVPMAALVAA